MPVVSDATVVMRMGIKLTAPILRYTKKRKELPPYNEQIPGGKWILSYQ